MTRQLAFLTLAILAGCNFDPATTGPVSHPDMRTETDAADASNDTAVADAGSPLDDSGVDAGLADQTVWDGGSMDMNDTTDANDANDANGTADASLMPLYATTEVVNQRLVVNTNLRPQIAACPSTTDVVCVDEDRDGLVDAWEQLMLERLRPFLVFDEEEQFFAAATATLAHVGRVAPGRRGLTFNIFLTILYDRDYGSCGTLSSHDGDSERVALTLREVAGGVIVERAYTAAHENTVTDHSMRFEGGELDQLEFDQSTPGEARWVVYPSRNKHATYITKAVCEGISPIPCFSESCGPDGVTRADFTLLADVYNAGEPDAPMLEDLGPIGFPDEQAWLDQPFCGGRGRGTICSGGVLGKLTTNPFQ